MSLPVSVELAGQKVKEMPFWPDFVFREMRVWLVLSGLLVTAAVFFPPSLGRPADLMAPAPVGIKPEWYFLFLFQTLKIFPARILFVDGDTVAVLLISLGVALFFLIPLIDSRPEGRRGKIITFAAWGFLLYAVAMTVWSLL